MTRAPTGLFQSKPFSFETRPNDLQKLKQTFWDILVIGGGITGTAIARDAALRGFKVALIESDDFASGTSSGSSKLIHGGIRYLENFEFALVRSAIGEREKLRKLYAPFVQDLSFVFPTHKNTEPSFWKLRSGLFLYDAFSSFRCRHQSLSSSQTLAAHPLLKKEMLTGSCIYTDSFAEDYRLVIELIKSAYRHGAISLNRIKAEQIIDHKNNGFFEVIARDLWNLTEPFRIQTKIVMNCSGPYSDEIRKWLNLPAALKLTQGVHFIVSRSKFPIETAYVISDPKLHRVLFAIPWNSITYFGTTDTSVKSVSEARAHSEDLHYILRHIRQYFNVNLKPEDVQHSWAAVRPLLCPPDNRNNSFISREHWIDENPKNCFHVLGGKLTSHRQMAEEALNLVKKGSSPTHKVPLQDKKFSPQTSDSRLNQVYGRYASDILLMDTARRLQLKPLILSLPHLQAEVLYSIYFEMALTPLDFLRRRSSLYYECATQEIARQTVDIFSCEFSWSEQKRKKAGEEIEQAYEWDQKGFKI